MRPLEREAEQKDKEMSTKIKVKETKISVVLEEEALDALVEAVKENGLYVNKEAVREGINEIGWFHRQHVPYTVVDADDYVRGFIAAAYDLYFSELERWEDGTPQIDFTRYFKFTYNFKYVALVG